MKKLTPEEKETLATYEAMAPVWGPQQEGFPHRDFFIHDFFSRIEGDLILDLGCGAGRCATWFLWSGMKYVGIDLSVGMLLRALCKFYQGT